MGQARGTARHRDTSPPAQADMSAWTGGAPRGMWWVAWRQHRLHIATLLAIVAFGAAVLVVLRARILSAFAEFDCERFPDNPYGDCVDAQGADIWWSHGFADFTGFAHTALLAVPIVLGVFAAAPIFTREFGRGTHVLALTQSVGRRRWFATKTTVMALPLVGGLLVLGYLTEWLDGAVGISAYGALGQRNFFVRAFIPAAVGLMVFGVTIALGMLTRNVLVTLVAGLVLGGAITVGVALVQPYLLPADRTTTPLTALYPTVTQADVDAEINGTVEPTDAPIDLNATSLTWGYLTTDGSVMDPGNAALRPCYNASTEAGDKVVAAWDPGQHHGDASESDADGAGSDGAGSGGPGEDTGTAPASSAAEAAPPGWNPYTSVEYRNASNAAMRSCMADLGITASYTDVLPGSSLWPLRWVVTGMLLALGALFIGVGAWRLRWAASKR